MKKYIFPLLFAFLSAAGSAQEKQNLSEKKNKIIENEIGVNTFSARPLGSWRPVHVQGAELNFLPGIYYKLHFGHNAIRASFDYRQFKLNQFFLPNSYYLNTLSSSMHQVELRFGYQRGFGSGDFRPFVYMDGVYNFYSRSVNATWLSPEASVSAPVTMSSSIMKRESYGMASGAGLKIKVSGHVSLSYEFAFYYIIDSKYHDRTLMFMPVRQLGIAYEF